MLLCQAADLVCALSFSAKLVFYNFKDTSQQGPSIWLTCCSENEITGEKKINTNLEMRSVAMFLWKGGSEVTSEVKMENYVKLKCRNK